MSHRIDVSSLLTRRYMRFDARGIAICESTVASDERVFAYIQIEAILLSSTGLLSFQIGQDVFKIQTKPGDAGHQEAINALMDYSAKAATPAAMNTVNNT